MGRLSEYDDIELRAMGLGSGWVEPQEDPRDAEIEHDYDIHHDPGDENDNDSNDSVRSNVRSEEVTNARH